MRPFRELSSFCSRKILLIWGLGAAGTKVTSKHDNIVARWFLVKAVPNTKATTVYHWSRCQEPQQEFRKKKMWTSFITLNKWAPPTWQHVFLQQLMFFLQLSVSLRVGCTISRWLAESEYESDRVMTAGVRRWKSTTCCRRTPRVSFTRMEGFSRRHTC